MLNIVRMMTVMMFLAAAFCHAGGITYAQHIKPVIDRCCIRCHSSGEAAPFALVTYEDAVKHASMIAYVISDGYMPPYRNDPSYSTFAGQHRLTEPEKKNIELWVKQGCVQGMVPKRTTHKGASARRNGIVWDDTLRMPSRLSIPASTEQLYICYAIPFENTSERYVTAIEYVPGNRKLSHHASYQVLEVAPDVDLASMPTHFVYRDSQYVDDEHDYRYFGLNSAQGGPYETFHGGWLPGTSAWIFPQRTGFRMPKRGVFLIRNLHYSPTPVASSDSATIRIRYGKHIERSVLFASFKPVVDSSRHIIYANTRPEYRIFARIHDDVSIVAINPHMHLLGTSFKVWVETPSGDTIPLVHIPQWDFDWQEFYFPQRLIHVPKGSVLNAIATYDNTEGNARNPNRPPKDVPFEQGMNDTNEMMRLVLLMLPYVKGDEVTAANDTVHGR